MRIAHLVSHAALNGVATSSRTLIQAQLDAGHQVLLVHSRNSWIERQAFTGPIDMLASDLATTPAEIRRVGYAIRDWGHEVVHAHGSRGNKHAMVYRCAAGTPIVMTAHTRQPQLPWAFAHEVIAPSAQTADYYLSRLLVRRKHMHVVPHMFDIRSVEPVSHPLRAAARASLGLRPEAFVVGSVGDICPRKNQLDMVTVLARLVAAGIDAELLLIGPFADAAREGLWGEALGDPLVANRVHLVGERNDAVALMGAMDAYLCTSRMEEGPIATLEAMATELPVLTVDVGYSSELIVDGESGHLFGHGDVDAMAGTAAALAGDATLRGAIGAAARRAVARLEPPAIVSRIDHVYRLAAARARQKPAQK